MTKTKHYFDSVASDYAERSESVFWKPIRNNEAEVLMTMLEGRPLGDVLELGSGSGYYTKLLQAQNPRRLVCVDFSSKMLEKLTVPGCEKIQTDIQDYRNQAGFDTILCAGALEFLKSPEPVFKNVADMLKPQGVFVILVPRDSLAGKIYQLFHGAHGVDIVLYSLPDIQKWADGAELAVTNYREAPLFSLIVRFERKGKDAG